MRRTWTWIRGAAATLEGMAERHWPFAAYSVLSVATGVYVCVQMIRI